MNVKPSWDEYFLLIAAAVAERADCSRRKVGAVLTSRNRIVATGYNGSPSGGGSCLAGECPRGTLGYDTIPANSSYDTGAGVCIALHAEQNCLLYADRSRAESGTLYVTAPPCPGCDRMIAGSGVARVVWVVGGVVTEKFYPQM
jgi:dCMP deaminase